MQDVLTQRLALEPVGSPIVGSKLFRQYCRGCGEPIRVVEKDRLRPGVCQDCKGTAFYGTPALPRRIHLDTDTMSTDDLGRLLGINFDGH